MELNKSTEQNVSCLSFSDMDIAVISFIVIYCLMSYQNKLTSEKDNKFISMINSVLFRGLIYNLW